MNQIQRQLVIAIIGTCLLVMLVGWWLGTGQDMASQASRLIAIGRLAGIVATAAVLLELLVMSRAPFIEKNFDLEEINTFHRYNGYTMVFALIAHIVFLVIGYNVNSHIGLFDQFIQFNTGFEDVLKASIGSIFFFAVALSSIKLVRRALPYEAWYFLHIVVYGSVLLAFGHQIHAGGDIVTQTWLKWFWIAMYGAVFGTLLYWRFARPLWQYARHGFYVSRVSQEVPGIYSIYVSGRAISDYKYEPGQYAHWRFFTKELWTESHPFSFSSSPGSGEIRFTFKTSGDYTELLARLKPGARVLIDGPRGSFTADRARQNNVLLIAGGIGVAPLVPAARKLLQDNKNVQVLYSARKRSDLAFGREFEYMQQVAGSDRFAVKPYVTSESGRLSEATLSRFIDGYAKQMTVYVCGPDAMSRAVTDMLESLGVPPRNIVAERFTF